MELDPDTSADGDLVFCFMLQVFNLGSNFFAFQAEYLYFDLSAGMMESLT